MSRRTIGVGHVGVVPSSATDSRSGVDRNTGVPVLRIHFTAADVARVRVVPRTHLMWETVLSLHVLQHRDGSRVFDDWRRQVVTAVRREGLGDDLRSLCHLNPNTSYFPDFLTPTTLDDSPEQAIRRIGTTPADLVRTDLEQLLAATRSDGTLEHGWTDGTDTRDRLAALLLAYYRLALGPIEGQLHSAVAHDVASRSVDAGDLESFFGSFSPGLMRWRAPCLEVNAPDGDVHLDGRGLRLIPSSFAWLRACKPADARISPTIVYPVRRRGAVGSVTVREPDAPLRSLLGPARARVLAAASNGGTTTSIGRVLGMAPSSASEHLQALRGCSLVESRRRGRAVVHSTTPAAERLLAGNGPAPVPG